ncbi:hypothetical protein L208DRAFT_1152494, partial [Tricholoma matsutake]
NNDNPNNDEDDLPTIEEVVDNNEEEDNDNDEGRGEEEDSKAGDDEDEVDEAFDSLTEEERGQLLNNTAAVCTTLDKICKLSFAIVHSTTITLPVWCAACITHGWHVRLIPCDVKTRWNSTYDMLMVTFDYHIIIDNMT